MDLDRFACVPEKERAMRIRIVVASQADVTFYDTQNIGDKLEVIGRLTDPLVAHEPESAVRAHLPAEAFRTSV
jgi:hypothetical protein